MVKSPPSLERQPLQSESCQILDYLAMSGVEWLRHAFNRLIRDRSPHLSSSFGRENDRIASWYEHNEIYKFRKGAVIFPKGNGIGYQAGLHQVVSHTPDGKYVLLFLSGRDDEPKVYEKWQIEQYFEEYRPIIKNS